MGCYTIHLKTVVSAGDVLQLRKALEATNDVVYLSKLARCRRYTLRGVPARLVDVIIDERIENGRVDNRCCIVAEAGTKSGRFDGATRDRIAIRILDWTGPDIAPGRVVVEGSDATIAVSLLTGIPGAWTAGAWTREWSRLRSDLNSYDLPRIVYWHVARYYTFLWEAIGSASIDAIAATWPLEWAFEVTGVRVADVESAGVLLTREGKTLAEANRSASRALYAAARDAGWAKLTVREQSRLGLTGQWHSDDEVSRARELVRGWSGTGASEDSLTAARTGHWSSTEQEQEPGL